MSLTKTSRVSCLTCNSVVEVGSTKNIYKTAFTQTGKDLASFVKSTLSLEAKNLRSSYLCLQCLNLFGKLEAASRRVKSIECEIHKIFEDSYSSEIDSRLIIQNAAVDTPANDTNTQIPFVKPRAVITQCIRNKSTSTSVQKITIINNLRSPRNVEEENAVELEDNHLDIQQINSKTHQESLQHADPPAEQVASALDDNDVSFVPSLKDHQYTQLSTVNHKEVSISKETISMQQKVTLKIEKTVLQPKRPEVSTAAQPKVALRIEKRVLAAKKQEVPKPEAYTCSNCGIKQNTMKDLRLHYKTHSDLYPYMCEKCGKVYKNKKSLRTHVITHEQTKDYICTICDKCFTQKGAFKRHLSMHTGEKPYECEICSKKFVNCTSYKMHVLMHSEDRRHKCDQCSYAFASASNLKRHMRRFHGGEKQYSCEICGKRFFKRYDVQTHMKTHDPIHHRLKEAKMKQKRVAHRRCERCKIDFPSVGKYNVHIRKHTPENMPCSENKYIHGIQLFESNDARLPA